MKRIEPLRRSAWLIPLVAVLLGACQSAPPPEVMAPLETPGAYIIGPGDVLQIYVRNNKDLSVTIPVRPDGRISIPLVQEMQAAGKTPAELGGNLQEALSKYVRQPIVTVIVKQAVGSFSEQVRVVGEAAKPHALSYRRGMTLLDVLIEVGGLTPVADGNGAKLIRKVKGKKYTFPVYLDDLLSGDTEDNMAMRPGDILIIPKSVF